MKAYVQFAAVSFKAVGNEIPWDFEIAPSVGDSVKVEGETYTVKSAYHEKIHKDDGLPAVYRIVLEKSGPKPMQSPKPLGIAGA